MKKTSSPTDVPDAPGIYFFYLANVTLLKVGLYKNVTADEEALVNARASLAKRLSKATQLFQSLNLKGRALENDRARKFSNTFLLNIEQSPHDIEREVMNLPLNLVPNVVKLLEQTSMANRPIYVGKAEKQSLRLRYEQHWNDFENEQEGTFGARVRAAGLQWDDLTHTCLTVDPYLARSSRTLSFLERTLHATCNPILSKR